MDSVEIFFWVHTGKQVLFQGATCCKRLDSLLINRFQCLPKEKSKGNLMFKQLSISGRVIIAIYLLVNEFHITNQS
jgi:hypothetical protein